MPSKRTTFNIEGLAHGSQPIPTAVRLGPLVVTGTINGRNRTTGKMPDSLREQIEQAFLNLVAVLEAADAGLDDLVKVTVYLADRSDRDVVNHVWTDYFPHSHDRPVRHVILTELPGDVLVQLEVLAYLSDHL